MCEPTAWIDLLDKLATVGAALVALYAALIARGAMKSQSSAAQWGANYSLLSKAYDLIGRENSILELHGASAAKLEKDGISVEEFIYILYQLEASDLYYRIKDEYPIKLSDYRKVFLRNQKVQLVWEHYLKDKFFHSSFLRVAIEDFIAEERKRR